MKTTVLLFTLIFSSFGLFAAEKTVKFTVYGNCGMCEERIEEAAKSVDGVLKAEWDKKTQMLKVTYDDTKVKEADIHKSIASAGHDTDMYKAKDKTYSSLPGCCKYERPTEETE